MRDRIVLLIIGMCLVANSAHAAFRSEDLEFIDELVTSSQQTPYGMSARDFDAMTCAEYVNPDTQKLCLEQSAIVHDTLEASARAVYAAKRAAFVDNNEDEAARLISAAKLRWQEYKTLFYTWVNNFAPMEPKPREHDL